MTGYFGHSSQLSYGSPQVERGKTDRNKQAEMLIVSFRGVNFVRSVPVRVFPRGVLIVSMSGRSEVFWGLKIYTLGIILGQEICHVFFRC